MRTKKKSLPIAAPVETIQQALTEAKNLLSIVTDNPVLEAEILLAHVLNTSRSYLHTWHEARLNQEQISEFSNCLLRRRNQEPIAYITGSREFWSLNFLVTPETLIPRPETELLVETILAAYRQVDTPIKGADLGTGCGAIALALAHEKPSWQIIATDDSESALQIAKKNAGHLGINNISFYHGHWCAALPKEKFDFIVSNPPYISEMEWDVYADGLAHEPREALVSGLDGLDSIRTIIHSAREHLNAAGQIFIEHGYLQGTAVRKIFSASGYSQIHTLRDLAGQERLTVAHYFP